MSDKNKDQKENKKNAKSKAAGTRRSLVILAVIAGIVVGFLIRGLFIADRADSTVTSQSESAPREKKEQVTTLWTCSMHPQIKLPKPGLCPICNMELIPLEEDSSDSGSLRELKVNENAAKLMDIQVTPVERKFVEAEIRMVGKIDYDETRLKYITAWVPGRLDRLYVDYTGVPVKSGDHMVYLYSPELLTAQEELLQAIEAVKNLKESDSGIVSATSEATVEAVREKLRLWGLTQEQIDEIERRGTANDHMTIYSPIGGIVIHKNAQEGMYVETGTRVYTVADLSQVWVQLDAYESDLTWLRYGQELEFTAESYPGEVFTGTIAFIDPVLTQTTRTVKIRVNAPNPEMKLKPGMFVRAVARSQLAGGGRVMDTAMEGKWICPMHPDVVKDEKGDCDICGMLLVTTDSLGYVSVDPGKAEKPLVVPASAVLLTGTRAIVYVQISRDEKRVFEGREIVLGPRAGDYYLVRHGLEEDELVVTKGNFKIDAELQIKAKPSMMTPEGGGGGSGLHHGEAAPGPEGKTESQAQLPVLVRTQLQAVVAASNEVRHAVLSNDLSKIRSAFTNLGEKVNAVSGESLTGHPSMLWNELSALISNDSVEGREVESISDAKRVLESLEGHTASLRAAFGLSMGPKVPTPEISAEFRDQLGEVVSGYLAIQEALAGDSEKDAPTSAKFALAALKAVDMTLLEGEAHMAWMKLSADLEASLSKIAEGAEIEPIRKEFALFSELMATGLKRFGPTTDHSLFQIRCPMAFDNRGAVWLQQDEEVNNPYFGSAMLRCGEIIDVIPGSDKKGGSGR